MADTTYVPALGMTYVAITDAGLIKVRPVRHCTDRPAAVCRVVGPQFKLVEVDYDDLVPAR